MPFFANQNRDQLRQMYFTAWRKHREQLPLDPVEAQVADVIALHPEYHRALEDMESTLNKDWLPEGGSSNPFLHMGLHLAVRDQIATDRPAGIRSAYQVLLSRHDSAHATEHHMIECLAEALWSAQGSGLPPNEAAYLASLSAR